MSQKKKQFCRDPFVEEMFKDSLFEKKFTVKVSFFDHSPILTEFDHPLTVHVFLSEILHGSSFSSIVIRKNK